VDPLLVIFVGPIVILLLFAMLLSQHPKRGRELVGELRPWRDHGAMAEIESHDTDDMLDSIDEHRRRRGGRDTGEELADEAMRASWEEPQD
jgi:hypothetical protein